MTYEVEALGYIKTCFPEKFGIPRQPLLVPSAKGELILSKPYTHDCVDGLDKVTHLWLSFIFHYHLDQQWKSKVRPPRLGGNKKCGVFATRSPFRPNNIGLSVVKLDKIILQDQQVVLHLSGVDLLDGTPIIDIKPYVPYADSIVDAENQLALTPPENIPVFFSEQANIFLTDYSDAEKLKQLLIEVLRQDPRPAYKKTDAEKIYKMKLLDVNVEWCCRKTFDESVINVIMITTEN
ncbi:MAG: tRNA (N6-threonylcarbamoyladenosine(37)-N6)-methyltransferase TrmO [Cellvibrionaceae bacterium]